MLGRNFFGRRIAMKIDDLDALLLPVPESFESDRLLIRAAQWGDGLPLNEAIAESIDDLRLWMPWAKEVPSADDSEAYVRRSRLNYLERKDMAYLLFHKQTGQLVGCSGLHRLDWQARCFEIGYWLRTSCTGQGYMTEAVHAITEFAVRELQASRIEVRCDSRNGRSAAVALRCGFMLEGTLRRQMLDTSGDSRDTRVYSKVKGIEF